MLVELSESCEERGLKTDCTELASSMLLIEINNVSTGGSFLPEAFGGYVDGFKFYCSWGFWFDGCGARRV